MRFAIFFKNSYRNTIRELNSLDHDYKIETSKVNHYKFIGAVHVQYTAYSLIPYTTLPTCWPYVIYEGGSICNENSAVYPKVLYLHTSKLLLLKYLFLG